ncbi:MAG: hypothetical protein J5760_06785 [Clostridia bacterium]|nr:hypothetical protein [Clostridia bacterium]
MKKGKIALLLALACALALFCFAAAAEESSGDETCRIDIQSEEKCFFVYYENPGVPVPSTLDKGTELQFKIVFVNNTGKANTVVKANGETVEFVDGKYYFYTVNEDTVFTVETSGDVPGDENESGMSLGMKLLIGGGIALVAVVVTVIVTNKKEEKKAGKKRK